MLCFLNWFHSSSRSFILTAVYTLLRGCFFYGWFLFVYGRSHDHVTVLRPFIERRDHVTVQDEEIKVSFVK